MAAPLLAASSGRQQQPPSVAAAVQLAGPRTQWRRGPAAAAGQ